MPVYVSMLRGINVGGHKRIEMARLRSSLEALGYREVRTYIQSGNIVFRTDEPLSLRISGEIERKIDHEFLLSVAVVTRRREELSRTIKQNPFLKISGVENFQLHVMFLPAVPHRAVQKELEQLTRKPDLCCLLGKDLYLYLPNGAGRSSLANNAIERRHLGQATMRNWNTVSALYQLAVDLG
jgi:uncharacterized protein (DUF1697 family)